MFSIIKFFKSLNSAQAEFQMSLALSFGIISGFLPFISLINLFIIVIVFSLNIPIGIYLIFVTLFTLVGSILDPYFHDVGLLILSNNNFIPLWTELYNTPMALWLNFNHTITMGSFVVSLVLFIPTYIISKIIFVKYREKSEILFKDSKYFSWLNPYSKVSKNNSSDNLIRWKGFAFITSLLLAIILFFILLFDPILKFTLEYGLSKATKSTVLIKDISSNLNTIKVDLNNIRVIKNGNENKVDSISITLDRNHLLYKKIDIKDLRIKNIYLNKEVSTYVNTDENKNEKKSNESSFMDKFKLDLPNINSMLENEDLKSIKEAKLIKKRFIDINNKWKNIKKDKIDTFDAKDIKSDFEKLRILSKNIKTPQDVKELIDKSNNLKVKIQKLKQEVGTLKNTYKTDKNTISNDLKKIKILPMDDYNYLASKYTLNKSGALNIVSTYISEDLKIYIEQATKYYNVIKPYLPQSEEDIEVIRQKGKWIKFKEINPYPNFILEKLNANVIHEKFDSCNIFISHINKTKMNIKVSNYKASKIHLDKKISLLNNIVNLNSNTTIEKFDSLYTDIKADFIKTNFNFMNKNNKSEKMVKNILDNIDSFYIKSDIKASIKDIKNMKISINSDLDKKISKGFKTQANIELKKYKEKLKVALRDKIKENIGDISQDDFDKYEKMLKNKDTLLDNLKKELLSKYDSKSISNKLKDKLKNKIQDKLKNKLKSFFKG